MNVLSNLTFVYFSRFWGVLSFYFLLIVKAKVAAAIVPAVKVQLAVHVVKAEEVATATPTIKVEVVEKKQRVKLQS